MSATSPIRDPRENPARLREFVVGLARTLESENDEAAILEGGRALLGALIAHDDWLPDEYAAPEPSRYQQYLLHCDSLERFSVVSFVWGPGQSTPVHDHRVWGLVGVLRGAEWSQAFSRNAPGTLLASAPRERLGPGSVTAVSPRIGDIHRVSNAYDDRVSISIHVYGANIGAVERATYDATGLPRRFVSGYANRRLPNLWDRSPDA
jgi:predicted metal-dependent enzyme (double-stranded beta helix superfamily)